MNRKPSGFNVYWKKEEDSGDFDQITVFGNGVKEYLLSRLDANTSYIIRVQVFFNKHKSPKSKPVTATTGTKDEGKTV